VLTISAGCHRRAKSDLTILLQNRDTQLLTWWREHVTVAGESKNSMLNGLNPGSLGAHTPRVAPGRLPALPAPKRKRDRAGKQRALMLAALRLFATKGYEATTTREIASAAGCAEGLIHRYFKGKAGLLPALVEYQIS
jgi:hypothetical protein